MLEKLGPIEYLRQIIISEMDIKSERVMIYNQKWNIPTDDGLFVVVEFKNAVPYSNRSQLRTADNVDEQNSNFLEYYTIGLYSRSTAALERKNEVVMALGSIFSQQQQEKGQFSISRIMPIRDLSPLEATALLYRIDTDFVVYAWYKKEKATLYYDQFRTRVLTENSDTTFDQEVPA